MQLWVKLDASKLERESWKEENSPCTADKESITGGKNERLLGPLKTLRNVTLRRSKKKEVQQFEQGPEGKKEGEKVRRNQSGGPIKADTKDEATKMRKK